MRRSIRLPGFDYAGPATYFVTIVTQARAPILGAVVTRRMVLSAAGRIVRREWLRSAELRKEVLLDAFVIMPDHFHAIVTFRPASARPHSHSEPRMERLGRSLGSLIAQFKATSTSKIRALRPVQHPSPCGIDPRRIWQRSFYESILRTPDAIARARWYVSENPRRWRGPTPSETRMG
jgi:putative transposase